MGLLDKIQKINPRHKSTKGFYFGSTEAEGENKKGTQNLINYFEDYLNILPLLHDGRFIFTGRKGSGKSAIAKYFKDTADKEVNGDTFADIIKIHDLQIEKLIQSDGFKEFENKEAVLFEWIILVRLIKLIIKNKAGRYTNEYKKLGDFIQRNSGIVDIDKFQINEVIQKTNYEVKFDVIRQVFGLIFSKYFDTKTNRAPFYKLVPALREVVETIIKFDVNKDTEFWLLFDDLDVDFKDNSAANSRKLIELIRVARKYNNEILKHGKARILIFVRDDIKRMIDSYEPDTAKMFSSYEIYINWYDHEHFKQGEHLINLKRFINKRIEINFKTHEIPFDEEDPWKSLFQESYSEFNQKSSFKYILDFTFYRPRDFILFFNPIGQENYEYPLSPKTIKILLNKYVKENTSELKNELSLHFTSQEIECLFQKFLPDVAKTSFNKYEALLQKLAALKFDKRPEEIIALLNSYSVLIYKDIDGKLFYNYRENPNFESLDKDKLYFTLPKNIYHYYADIH